MTCPGATVIGAGVTYPAPKIAELLVWADALITQKQPLKTESQNLWCPNGNGNISCLVSYRAAVR